MWRIYLKTIESRIKLLAESITIGSHLVPIHANNPFTTRNSDPNKSTVKITVKDIPLSFNNIDIKNMLIDRGADLCCDLKYSHIRDENGKLTTIKNGDRFTYAFEQSLTIEQLPRKYKCGGFTCRIYHKNQPGGNCQTVVCRNCWQPGHWATKCSNQRACAVCKKTDHIEGSNECEAYVDNQEKIQSVLGAREPLSAFHNEKVTFLDCPLLQQNKRSNTHELLDWVVWISTQIKEASSPWEAKELSKQLKSDADWDGQKSKVMSEILHCKVVQSPMFREALVSTGSKILVTPMMGDSFWGTGLNLELTKRTKPEMWPGRNEYGSILMSIRDQIQDDEQIPQDDTSPEPTRRDTRSSSSKAKQKSHGKSTRAEKIQHFFSRKPSKK